MTRTERVPTGVPGKTAPGLPTDIPLAVAGIRQDMPLDEPEVTSPLVAPSKAPDQGDWVDVQSDQDQWVDVEPKPDGLVARDGARASPEAAAAALEEGRRTGFGVEHFMQQGGALDPDTPRAQRIRESFRAAIEDTPGLYAYASRSWVHASAVAEDAEHWNVIEKFLTGKIEMMPTPPGWSPYRNGIYDPGMADAVRQTGGIPYMDAPPVWVGGMMKGAEGAWLSLKNFAQFAFGPGLGAETSAALQRSIEESRAEMARPLRGVAGPGSAVAAKVGEMVPQMAGLAVASLAGPEATFGLLWAQTIGDLKNAGVDDTLALGGGFVASSLGTWLGGSLLKSLIPRKAAYDASLAGVMAMRETIKSPLLRESFAKFGRLATHGMLMQLGMGVSNSITMQVQAGEFNPSRLYEDSLHAFADGLLMMPFAMISPVREHLEMRGRWVEAHADAMRIGGTLESLNRTGLAEKSPAEARDLMQVMGSRPVYLDPKVVESAAKVLGVDPSALAVQMTGRPGALEVAQNTGTPLQVPSENLGPLRDQADRVASGAKLTQDGSTFNEMRTFVPVAPEERLPSEPIPGTGEGTKPELRRYADDAVSRMTLGEIEANDQTYQRAADAAERAAAKAKEQALRAAEWAVSGAQAGVEAGVRAAETGREAAQMNFQFARTARLREWLKGLVLPEGARPPPEPTSAETGLYNIPEINAEVSPTEAQKWYSLGEAQRQQAIALYKESVRTQQKAEDLSVGATGQEVKAGDFVQQAAGHERTRDLNRAMEASRARQQAEGERIRNYLGKQASDSIRKSTYDAGVHFGIIYDEIYNSLGLRPQDSRTPRGGLDGALADVLIGGDELSFNVDHIRALSARPRELGDLLPWEADNVENAIRTIRRLANQATKTYVRGKEFERDVWLANMERDLAKGSGGGKFTYGEVPPGGVRRDAERANTERLWGVFGDYGADRLHQLDYALKLESDLQGHYLPRLDIPEGLRELAEREAQLPNIDRRDRKLRFLPDTIKQKDLWRMARMAGTKSGMAKLSAGFGVPEMEIERTLKSQIKTKAEWDFIDKGWQTNAELFQLESIMHAQRAGLPPLKLEPREMVVTHEDGTVQVYKGGYDPFRWFDGRDGARRPVSPDDPYHGLRHEMDTPHAFLKDRVEGFYSVPDVRWSNLKPHYASLIHDISHSNYVRDTFRMINDPAFREVVRNRMGQPWYDAMQEMIQVQALGRIVDGTNGAGWYGGMFRELKGLAASAAFNLNFPVIMGQVAHLPIVSAGLGIEPWHMAAAVNSVRTVEGWREAGESPVVSFRNDRYAQKINYMWQQQLGYGPNRYRDALSRASQEAQHLMDTTLSRTIYLAAKRKGLADGLSPEMAREAGDRAVSRGMPAMSVEMGSHVTRNRTWGLLTMVRNFPNAISNMRAMMDWETRVGISEGESAPWARAKQVGRTIGMMGGLGLGLYLMGHGKRDDETLPQYLGRTAITEYFYGNPVLHLAAQAVAPIVVGEGISKVNFFSTPAGEMLDRVVQDVGHLASRDRPMDQKMWDALDLMGRTIGAPLPPPLLRSAHGIYKLTRYHMLDRNDFYRTPQGPLDEASIALYGERRTGTPLTDLQAITR
jgi:hypothetical protein